MRPSPASALALAMAMIGACVCRSNARGATQTNAPAQTRPAAPAAARQWILTETKPKPITVGPRRLVPVEHGVWFGSDSVSSSNTALGFFSLERGAVTLLLEDAGPNWAAVEDLALAVHQDRTNVFRLNAHDRTVSMWEDRPAGCRFFNQLNSSGGRFYVNSPQNPLLIYNPANGTWQSNQLQVVKDADYASLGANYYRPRVHRFAIGADGDLWAFQGTLDATRGNAVSHYRPDEGTWEQHGFPWEMARGDDHLLVGVSDDAVWFAGRDMLLLDKKSGHWKELTAARPKGMTGPLAFTARGVFAPAGNTIERFDPKTSAWEPVGRLDDTPPITAVAEYRGALYATTATGFCVLRIEAEKQAGTPVFHLWEIAKDAKSYRPVFAAAAENPDVQAIESLCANAKSGDATAVAALLAQGADVEATTETDGSRPLHLAAAAGHLEIVKLLVDHGADVNARTLQRATPLTLANRNRHRAVADFLLSKGAER